MHLTIQHDCAVISLDGQWAYILDYADIGEQEQWYLSWDERQQGQVTLPGILTTRIKWEGIIVYMRPRHVRNFCL